MNILGIYREPECSPGRHRSNDALLLERVADELSARQHRLQLVTIDQALRLEPAFDLVVSMCQSPAALEQLLRWETDGVSIVNSPRAALNTYRDRLPTILNQANVRFPATQLLHTANPWAGLKPALANTGGSTIGGRRLWLKRGDVHASVPADVQRIESDDALERGLADFRVRGIAQAALQEHRDGEEIKFYGLADGAFFHWFYTGGLGSGAVDPDTLQDLGTRAARAAGLDIFGGDIIVEPSGELTLIDLNDWPSFAPCREAAAEAIADYLVRRVDAVWNTGVVSSANESAI
jgi:hypothetical protein